MMPILATIGFDATIHLSDLVVLGSGLLAFVKIFLSVQKILAKHSVILLGDPEIGAQGLIKDVLNLRKTVDIHNEALVESSWIDRRGNIRERRQSPLP